MKANVLQQQSHHLSGFNEVSIGTIGLLYCDLMRPLHDSFYRANPALNVLKQEIRKAVTLAKAPGVLRLVFHDGFTFNPATQTGDDHHISELLSLF